jgi:ABC-type nitrate/sulfonate/bicarbonate transport system substrate-binding protein
MSILHSTKVRRSAAILAAAVVSLTVLAGCAGTSDTPSGDGADAASFGELNLQLSWIKNEEFSGEFLADSKGYYSDEGLTVNMTPGPSTGTAELLSGTADVALSDAISIGTVVANEKAPLKIIAATYQKNPFTILSLAAGGNILTPQDMIGKKIGVQDSNTSLFNALLSSNGIDPSELTIVPVQYDPSVLINGDVDGFMAYLTNESLTVAAQGYPVSNLPFADNGLPFVAETITTTDQYIADNRDKLKAFLVAEIKGWTDSVNDPASGSKLAVEVYGADLGLDSAVSEAGAVAAAKLLVVSDETVANGLFTISDELQTETIASLKAAGIDVSADSLFDLSLLTEVYKEHPELVAYAG